MPECQVLIAPILELAPTPSPTLRWLKYFAGAFVAGVLVVTAAIVLTPFALPDEEQTVFHLLSAPRMTTSSILGGPPSTLQPLQARVAGVDIPNLKKVEYSLQSIYGVGPTIAKQILENTGPSRKSFSLLAIGCVGFAAFLQAFRGRGAESPLDDVVPLASEGLSCYQRATEHSSFSHESRAARMVLQAAKGKGKGGGGKGKVAGIIKLALPAGKATPAPPVGPALGQYGLNIVQFCKEYNAATEKDAADGMIIPVEITAMDDRTYTFVLKTPPASVLLRKAAKVQGGSANPKKEPVGSITVAQLEEIAKTKLPDLNTRDVKMAMRIVEGTAKNMGITILA